MGVNWSILSKYRNELYGLTTLWIILFHGLGLKNTTLPSELSILKGILKHGNCGVEIFLFLSGVSLYYSMKKDSDIKNFYLKRLTRIIIPFFLIDGIYWIYTIY